MITKIICVIPWVITAVIAVIYTGFFGQSFGDQANPILNKVLGIIAFLFSTGMVIWIVHDKKKKK